MTQEEIIKQYQHDINQMLLVVKMRSMYGYYIVFVMNVHNIMIMNVNRMNVLIHNTSFDTSKVRYTDCM